MTAQEHSSPALAGTSDYRPSDLALAGGTALLILCLAAAALGAARLGKRADAPPIDPGIGDPLKVRPVLDPQAYNPRLGGGRTALPSRWQRNPALAKNDKPAESEDSEEEIELDADAGSSAEGAAGGPPTTEGSASEEPSGPGGAGPGGEGDPEGSPDGEEPDPLRSHAIGLYRARLSSWLSSRFRITGSGLSREELLRYRVVATVQIGSSNTVVSYSITPSGNAVFDSAARAALESVLGEQLPPPPDGYPEVQKQISVTFLCRETTCS